MLVTRYFPGYNEILQVTAHNYRVTCNLLKFTVTSSGHLCYESVPELFLAENVDFVGKQRTASLRGRGANTSSSAVVMRNRCRIRSSTKKQGVIPIHLCLLERISVTRYISARNERLPVPAQKWNVL